SKSIKITVISIHQFFKLWIGGHCAVIPKWESSANHLFPEFEKDGGSFDRSVRAQVSKFSPRAGTTGILTHLFTHQQMNPRLFQIFKIALAGFVAGHSFASTTLIKAGRLLNPRTGNVLSPAAVLIDNNKIKEVGPPPQVQAHLAADVKIIDLGNA